MFSKEEILFSQRYIFKLRHGDWPPKDWLGLENYGAKYENEVNCSTSISNSEQL